MLRLADRYAEGLGVQEDLPQALSWYAQAADQNHPVAMGMQGLLLITGQAGRKDVSKGIELTRRAAIAGDAAAMFNMGEIHANGLLGNVDAKANAMEWYRKALRAGHGLAGQSLASLERH